MEDMTSSKLALRSLLKDSREKRASSLLTEERPKINALSSHPDIPETDEKRKEQLRLGKVIFEFFEKMPEPHVDEPEVKRSKGRPIKPKTLKAKNITICLSKEHIELLDRTSFNEKNTKGRGRKVRFLMDSYLKYQNREKEQVRTVQESLRVIALNIDTFSKHYKRAEKFAENEKSIIDLEKSISNLRIVLSLLKIDVPDLKRSLTDKEWSTYQFSLSWLSNRSGNQ